MSSMISFTALTDRTIRSGTAVLNRPVGDAPGICCEQKSLMSYTHILGVPEEVK